MEVFALQSSLLYGDPEPGDARYDGCGISGDAETAATLSALSQRIDECNLVATEARHQCVAREFGRARCSVSSALAPVTFLSIAARAAPPSRLRSAVRTAP